MTIEAKYYLRANVISEPLINNWYAWLYTYVPQTMALLTSKIHKKIIDSYLESPELHEHAVRQPELRGGPFMDFTEKSIDKVRELYHKTTNELGNYLELADSMVALSNSLSHCIGES